jgi:uncharacterized protein (TIGR02001 family)
MAKAFKTLGKTIALAGLFFGFGLQAQNQPEETVLAENGSLIETEDESQWPEFSASLTYASAYLYNGFIWNSGNVFHPEISLEWKGFFAGVWATWDCTNANGEHDDEFEEWNYYLGYGHSFPDLPTFGELHLELTWVYYDFPSFTDTNYQDLMLKATLEDLPLKPALTAAWNYEDDIFWLGLETKHSVPVSCISDKLSFDMCGELFWNNRKYNDYNYDVNKSALAALQLKAGLNYQVCEYFNLGPFVACAWAIEKDLRKAWREDSMNNAFNVLWGFALNAEF